MSLKRLGLQLQDSSVFNLMSSPLAAISLGYRTTFWGSEMLHHPVSFFMPAYNCAATIEESVSSILRTQIHPDDEVVIVNDGSTDETGAIAQRLAEQHGCIRLLCHEANQGGAAARNTAVENASHDSLFCLDSDNVLDASSMLRLRQYAEDHEVEACSFQRLNYFKVTKDAVTHSWDYGEGVYTLADHLSGPVVPGASGNYFFSRDSWRRAGGYPEGSGALDTWGFALRQHATGTVIHIVPQTEYFHRYGYDSYWVRDSRERNLALLARRILEPYGCLIHPDDLAYVFAEGENPDWLGDLKQRPVRIRSGITGRSGTIHHAIDCRSSGRSRSFMSFLRKAYKGFLPANRAA